MAPGATVAAPLGDPIAEMSFARLDARLMSYVLAYALCELPGLPALLFVPELRGNDDATYLDQQVARFAARTPSYLLRRATSLQPDPSQLPHAIVTSRPPVVLGIEQADGL